MKKTYVPFTSVSVDPEIQRMRDRLTSGEDLFINDDGTIGGADDPQFEDATTGGKAKTVPKAIVSAMENGRSVRDLINDIRNGDGSGSADMVAAEAEDAAESALQEEFKKPRAVPKSILSTRSVSDLINEMRGGENSETEDMDDNVEAYVDEPPASSNPKLVPKTVVS